MRNNILIFAEVAIFIVGLLYSVSIPEKTIAQIKMKQFTPTIVDEATPTLKPTRFPTALPSPLPVTSPEIISSTPINCSVIDIEKMVKDISETNLKEYLANLVSDNSISGGHNELRTRASNTLGNRIEAAYIKSHYDKYGITNNFQLVPSAKSDNIIASIKGKKENEVYLVTGHFDSVTTAAADDNGSGTAVVMEIARVIKQSGFCPNYSLEFINFTGEELGLYGSIHYVRNLPSGKIIKGVINLDMVSNPSASGDCVNFVSAPYNSGSEIAQKAVEVDKKYSIGLNARAASGSIGASDHYPFEIKGYPAVFGTECSFNSVVYHKPIDTSDKINYRQVANTAKVVAATLVELASK